MKTEVRKRRGNWRLVSGDRSRLASPLAGERHCFLEVGTLMETKHRATVCMRASYQFWDFWRQCYWFQSWELKLHFVPSSLEADEVKVYFFCMTDHMDAVIWSCRSWENSSVSCVRHIDIYIARSFLFGPSGVARVWKDFRHNALGPFGHSSWRDSSCKLCALAIAKFCVQKISLQDWLWMSKGVWKCASPVDAIHNTYNV